MALDGMDAAAETARQAGLHIIEDRPEHRHLHGGRTWPAAARLAVRMLQTTSSLHAAVKDCSVLELGSGTGAAGLAAARAGARFTVLTDRGPFGTSRNNLVATIAETIARNGLGQAAAAAALDWSQCHGNPHGATAAARTAMLAGGGSWPPDVILASDCAYNLATAGFIADALDAIYAGDDAPTPLVVLGTQKDRWSTEEALKAFAQRGWATAAAPTAAGPPSLPGGSPPAEAALDAEDEAAGVQVLYATRQRHDESRIRRAPPV